MLPSGVLSAVFVGLLCAHDVLSLPLKSTVNGPNGPNGGVSTSMLGSPTTGSPGSLPTSSVVGTPGGSGTPSGNNSSSGAFNAPYFVVYNDRGPDPAPDVSKIKGFNVVALSFLLSTGPADMALAWKNLDASKRSSILQQYKQAGIKLIVSAFGSTEQPTTKNLDPKQTASTMAQYVKQYDLDGIDVDYEDIDAMNKADGKAEQWLVAFTNALRTELPQGKYLLTHAPMAPWMGSSPSRWKSGAYLTVNKQVGSKIDFYNIQFYNQGVDEYTTCDGLLKTSSSANPKSSLFEIAAQGFDLNKLVIGKPGAQADASNGQMSASMLAQCLQQAKAQNWNGGAMSWQYPNADTQWVQTVRGSAFGGSSGGSSDTGSSSPEAPSSVNGGPGAIPTPASPGSGAPGTLPTSPTDPTDPTDPASGAPGAIPAPAGGPTGSDSNAPVNDPADTTTAPGGAAPSPVVQGGVQGSSWSATFAGTIPGGIAAATPTPAAAGAGTNVPVRRFSRLNRRRSV